MEPFSADFAPKFIQKRTLFKILFIASNGISKYLLISAEKVAKGFNGYLCIGKEHPLKIDPCFLS